MTLALQTWAPQPLASSWEPPASQSSPQSSPPEATGPTLQGAAFVSMSSELFSQRKDFPFGPIAHFVLTSGPSYPHEGRRRPFPLYRRCESMGHLSFHSWTFHAHLVCTQLMKTQDRDRVRPLSMAWSLLS